MSQSMKLRIMKSHDGDYIVTSFLISLSAAAILVTMAPAVFAQDYAAPGAILLKPGQAPSPIPATVHALVPNTNVTIIALKPGETSSTATTQDYALTTSQYEQAGSFQLLKPGEAPSPLGH